MSKMRRGFALCVWLIIISPFQTIAGLPDGVTPVMATWLYGRYTLPSDVRNGMFSKTFHQSPGEPLWTELAAKDVKPNVNVPVVLYMHGCKGRNPETDKFRNLLISEGYAFFMPDSFQRPGRKKCGEQGPLEDRVKLRTEEVEYALAQIRELPWVDQKRVILMGFSEGGNTTDNWSKPGFVAHIIIGSACTLVGGVPAAPPDVPVLAIVGKNDKYRPGLSCKIERTIGGSQSIVIPGAGHSVAQYPETQKAIKEFLHQCCS